MQTFDYYPRRTGVYFETAEEGLRSLRDSGRGQLLAVSLRGDQTWFGPYSSLLGDDSFEGIMEDEQLTDVLTFRIVEILGKELQRRDVQPTMGITADNTGSGFVQSLHESMPGMVQKRANRSGTRIFEARSNMEPVRHRLDIIRASVARIGLDTAHL